MTSALAPCSHRLGEPTLEDARRPEDDGRRPGPGPAQVAGVVFPAEPVPGRELPLRGPPYGVRFPAGETKQRVPFDRRQFDPRDGLSRLVDELDPHVRPAAMPQVPGEVDALFFV